MDIDNSNDNSKQSGYAKMTKKVQQFSRAKFVRTYLNPEFIEFASFVVTENTLSLFATSSSDTIWRYSEEDQQFSLFLREDSQMFCSVLNCFPCFPPHWLVGSGSRGIYCFDLAHSELVNAENDICKVVRHVDALDRSTVLVTLPFSFTGLDIRTKLWRQAFKLPLTRGIQAKGWPHCSTYVFATLQEDSHEVLLFDIRRLSEPFKKIAPFPIVSNPSTPSYRLPSFHKLALRHVQPFEDGHHVLTADATSHLLIWSLSPSGNFIPEQPLVNSGVNPVFSKDFIFTITSKGTLKCHSKRNLSISSNFQPPTTVSSSFFIYNNQELFFTLSNDFQFHLFSY